MSDDENDLVHLALHTALARIAELESALNSMTIERGQAQAERDEILHSKHDHIAEIETERGMLRTELQRVAKTTADRCAELEAEVTRLKSALAEEIEHARRAGRAAIRARHAP